MKKVLTAILFVVLLSIGFWAGSRYGQREVTKEKTSAAKAFNPLCQHESAAMESMDEESSLPPGTVRISPERQQLIGVRLDTVEKAAQVHTLRTLGRVAVDETRVYRINIAVDGWITKTFDKGTGTLVKKGETMASFYSPEFLAAEQAYIYALSSYDRFEDNPRETRQQLDLTKLNIQQYKDSLRNLGMGDFQIEELGRTRQFTENINIASPVDGFIVARAISVGERFEKGLELYRIADLSRVWVLADVYENEFHDFTPGTEVHVFLGAQKKKYTGVVSTVLPLFDATTRTLKVRLEVDNADLTLRPDMFVDVELPVELPAAVTVPVDALLDSGFKKTVFVDRGNGYFEPREVETGWRLGNRVEIIKGLEPGERVVTSGTFLVDSESRLEMAATGMTGSLSKDPVCGMDVSINKAEKAGREVSHQDTTYYFCSEACMEQFSKDPSRHLKTPDHDHLSPSHPTSPDVQISGSKGDD